MHFCALLFFVTYVHIHGFLCPACVRTYVYLGFFMRICLLRYIRTYEYVRVRTAYVGEQRSGEAAVFNWCNYSEWLVPFPIMASCSGLSVLMNGICHKNTVCSLSAPLSPRTPRSACTGLIERCPNEPSLFT